MQASSVMPSTKLYDNQKKQKGLKAGIALTCHAQGRVLILRIAKINASSFHGRFNLAHSTHSRSK